jgi:hypothetical protein
MDGDVRMVAFVGKERGDSGGGARSIVVGELRERKEFGPVILLIIAKDSQVLFKSLVSTFGLAITFRVISGGKMQSHVQSFSEGPEESGDKFGATIGGNMGGYSVLGENVHDKEFCKVFRGASGGGRNEYRLLREAVYNDEDRVRTS